MNPYSSMYKANYGSADLPDLQRRDSISRVVISTAQLALLMLAPWALFATLSWALMSRQVTLAGHDGHGWKCILDFSKSFDPEVGSIFTIYATNPRIFFAWICRSICTHGFGASLFASSWAWCCCSWLLRPHPARDGSGKGVVLVKQIHDASAAGKRWQSQTKMPMIYCSMP